MRKLESDISAACKSIAENRFETTKQQNTVKNHLCSDTYCRTVTVMSPQSRRKIETAQRQAAKWALGDPALNIANELLEGELGMDNF